MQPSGSKDSLPEEANQSVKKSQDSSKLSRRFGDALNRSINTKNLDVDSEASPSKKGMDGKSPSKSMRKSTLLKGNRMKQQQSMYGEDGAEPRSPDKHRRTSMLNIEGENRRIETEEDLEELRNMIHVNEWHNIPACVRSAVMGLIDYNDKMTMRMLSENTMIMTKIQGLQDTNVK